MGNIDTRAQFQGGYIYVKTDRPYYYPGNTVYGKIYIRTQTYMEPQHIEIYVKGKEKASFYEFENHERRDADGTVHRERRRHHRYYSRKIMHFKGVCFTFQGPLNPGDYTIPFEFTLPANMPSSIIYENRNREDHPWCKVKYTAQAILVMRNNTTLKYKQWIVIHEPPVPFVENSQSAQTVRLTTCCC